MMKQAKKQTSRPDEESTGRGRRTAQDPSSRTGKRGPERNHGHFRPDWEQMFQAIGHPTLILNPDHTIIQANRAAVQATSLTEEELKGKKCFHLFHGRDFHPATCPLEKMLASGQFETVEMEMETLQGAFLVSCTPLLDGGGGLERIIHIATDITDRKKAEEALRESEERFRLIFEQAPIGIYRTTPQGDILMANPTLVHLLGYESFAELAQRNLEREGHDPHYPRAEFKRRMQAEGQVMGFESVWIRKDGTPLFLRENARNIPGDDGRPAYYEGTVEDITQTKRIEEALRESQATLRSIIQAAPLGIGLVTEKAIGWTNEAFSRITGYSTEELAGKSARTIYESDAEFQRFDVLNQTETHCGRAATIETRLKRKDGTVVEALLGRCPIDPLNPAKGTVLTVLDISDRKRAEETLKAHSETLEAMVQERTRELREAQDQLVRQERLAVLGQLAGSVGHELRNPLGVINNAVYYLKTILPDADAKTKLYLDIISTEIGNSERIVSDLLDFSRVRAADKKAVHLSDLVKEAIDTQQVPERIRIEAHIPPDLPMVFVDPPQIRQVLTNLLTNAVQAMPGGGTLTIRAATDQGLIRLAVQDTGVGISKADLKKIFEPLFTTKAKGIGLGLAVSRNLVEANGGSIEVNSQEGLGSTFTLILPLQSTPGTKGPGPRSRSRGQNKSRTSPDGGPVPGG